MVTIDRIGILCYNKIVKYVGKNTLIQRSSGGMTMKIKRLFAAVTSAIVLVSGTAGMNICASDSEEEISGSTLENIDVYEELVIRVNNERAEMVLNRSSFIPNCARLRRSGRRNLLKALSIHVPTEEPAAQCLMTAVYRGTRWARISPMNGPEQQTM